MTFEESPFGMDDRGLAMSIGIFFITIITGALVYFIVEPAALPLLDAAEVHTSRQSSAQGQMYVRNAVSNAHFIVIGFGILQLLATAVYENRIGGGARP